MILSSVKITVYPKDQSLNAKWFVCYSISGGPRQKKYGKLNKLPTVDERLQEVQRLILEIESEIENPVVYSNKQVNRMVQLLTAEFESRCLFIKKKSAVTYRSVFNEYIRWLRFQHNAEDVKTLGLGKAFIKYLQKKGLSPTRINFYRETLKSFYSKSKELKHENAFEDVPKMREHRVSAKFFTKYQQMELEEQIQAVHPQLWLACKMMYFLLLRPGDELRLIKIQEINLHDQLARVTGTDAKNDKTLSVRIPDEFIADLLFLKQYPPEYYVFGSKGIPGPVAHTKKYFPDKHQAILRNLKYNTDLYKFYSWKHTGAAMYYMATKDIKGLKEQGRWHSLDMVQEYLKNIGVVDLEEIKTKFPGIGVL